ncbi:hypothetical protein FGE12_27695 [Aggregicoccus sp. 17bor-14]|uniref:hypothetical protein n=1 Tax=Myxococcaceae TaxID=31 RepID=UPI00129CBBFE|nr:MULTISPECIES: hypothetical protein [Myxococcaceae]MBF5046230.1 hypothetical protein [Simulacricoccus sp. 17bor-14]MRI91954.1 hypothetical protein [Aggregicoccus sp. 17bor-14]
MSKAGRWVVAGVLGLALAGCGGAHSYTLKPVEHTSGASGQMKVETGENGNQRVQLKVEHLPKPSDIDGRFKTYVLWFRPSGSQDWKNMGALKLNDDRQAHIDVVTPFPKFDAQVTAEPDSTEASPTGTVVLQGQQE